MNQVAFTELTLTPEIRRAVEDLGFDMTTDIQAQSIPLIQSGRDVIGRSQTGTGKTLAFGIPAIEAVDTSSDVKNQAQVLILCPTRELAMQACDEIKKLAKYTPGIRTADVYGGAPMDRQILKLKTANIVVGTPGRVMDHMRRKTLKLDHLKMIVLDEADEMLSMGFREDIETILTDTPAERQTVLFSATMPPAILALTKTYQRDPELIQINKEQKTVENIEQSYYDVPMGRKMDALYLIIKYHNPSLSMIFCNTKRMVDDISEYLNKHDLPAEGLHGDMKQSQRTKVMDSFKHGRTSILVATDVAARGIDVNDIEYVINYDIPQSTEYYVHRIGRTGRAGKAGKAITICSGRRQVGELMEIGRFVKSTITRIDIPKPEEIRFKKKLNTIASVEDMINNTEAWTYQDMVQELIQRGYDAAVIATAVMEMHFGKQEEEILEIKSPMLGSSVRNPGGRLQKISINVGRQNRVAPNHIVGAITGCTNLTGKDIGKIEIFDDETIVSIPESEVEQTIAAMADCKITGRPTVTKLYKSKEIHDFHSAPPKDYRNLRKKSYNESYNRHKPKTF